MSERQLGVTLDDFVLKDQGQNINENVKKTLISQHKRPIKSKRGKDKDNQDVGLTFMITTAAAVRKVYVFKGERERERAGEEDKGNIEKRQVAANREKKNRNINDERNSGGEEEDAVSNSSGKRGRGSGSGSNRDKVGSKIYRSIDKSRRGEISSNEKMG